MIPSWWMIFGFKRIFLIFPSSLSSPWNTAATFAFSHISHVPFIYVFSPTTVVQFGIFSWKLHTKSSIHLHRIIQLFWFFINGLGSAVSHISTQNYSMAMREWRYQRRRINSMNAQVVKCLPEGSLFLTFSFTKLVSSIATYCFLLDAFWMDVNCFVRAAILHNHQGGRHFFDKESLFILKSLHWYFDV